MPINTPEQLSELQEQIRLAVADADLEAAFHLLEEALPTGRPKANQVTLLNGRANDILDFDINNTLSTDQLAILRNELRLDLLIFVDHLTLHDFSTKASTTHPELKPGHLLYQVPPKMAVRETQKCLVRIAHLLNQVLEGLTFDESISLEEIPVSEVMEVEIIDPSPAGNRAFDILLLSDGEQVVDEFMATEWVFNVRPLREGQHELVLKISVLITVGDKERTKNIVLSRPITVSAELTEKVEPALIRVLEPQGFLEEEMIVEREPPPSPSPPPLSSAPAPAASSPPKPKPTSSKTRAGGSGGPIVPLPSPSPSPMPERRSPRKRYSGWMNIAAAALVLLVATFLLLPSGNGGQTNPDSPAGPSNDDNRANDLPLLQRDTMTGQTGASVITSRYLKSTGDTLVIRDTIR